MKEFIKGMIFWSIFLGIIFLIWGIAEFIAAVITMKTIIKIVFVTTILGSIYILKETKEV